MANNRVKGLRVHAVRSLVEGRLETECGTIGRTYVKRVSDEPIVDEWRTALGNPFAIAPPDGVTCPACKRWLKVKK